jgi:integration host factor subunit beta
MTKSDLIELLANEVGQFSRQDVDDSVDKILERMSAALSSGQRIEVRDFGAFSLRDRPPRMARNPRTGEAVAVDRTHAVHFKPGKELRERVNNTYRAGQQ